MSGDNEFYLSMIKVVRFWSTRHGPTCTSIWYCPMYCNPFAMCWLEGLLCSRNWLVWGLIGLKKVGDYSLLMNLCDCIFVLQHLPVSCCVLARTSPCIVDPHIPLPCVMSFCDCILVLQQHLPVSCCVLAQALLILIFVYLTWWSFVIVFLFSNISRYCN